MPPGTHPSCRELGINYDSVPWLGFSLLDKAKARARAAGGRGCMSSVSSSLTANHGVGHALPCMC